MKMYHNMFDAILGLGLIVVAILLTIIAGYMATTKTQKPNEALTWQADLHPEPETILKNPENLLPENIGQCAPVKSDKPITCEYIMRCIVYYNQGIRGDVTCMMTTEEIKLKPINTLAPNAESGPILIWSLPAPPSIRISCPRCD